MKELIYFVDDDEINNMANERLLRKMKIEVLTRSFVEPEEALKALEAHDEARPNLILLDINMPKINGWEFLKRYEKMNLSIPIVMLSSSLDPHDKLRADSSTVLLDFIPKPLLADQVKQIFSRCGIGHLISD